MESHDARRQAVVAERRRGGEWKLYGARRRGGIVRGVNFNVY